MAFFSSRTVLAVAIAAKRAGPRRVAGGSGKPNSGIGPVRKGGLDAGNNRVAGGRDSVRRRKRLLPLHATRRARVIPQAVGQVLGKNSRAIDRVVTRGSIAHLALLGSVSVRPYVTGLYDLLVCETDVGKVSATDVR